MKSMPAHQTNMGLDVQDSMAAVEQKRKLSRSVAGGRFEGIPAYDAFGWSSCHNRRPGYVIVS